MKMTVSTNVELGLESRGLGILQEGDTAVPSTVCENKENLLDKKLSTGLKHRMSEDEKHKNLP